MVFTLLTALLCVLFLFLVDNIRFLKPSEQVSHIIVQCASEEQISPSLLEAVILTESKFNERRCPM